MHTPAMRAKIDQGTPEKVVDKSAPEAPAAAHPLCSAFVPEDFVDTCERPADVQLVLPNGRVFPGLSFCDARFAVAYPVAPPPVVRLLR